MLLKFFDDGSPCVCLFVEDNSIQAGARDQAGNLHLRRVVMTMDDEHVFRELGRNGGGLLGCRFSEVGDLLRKASDLKTVQVVKTGPSQFGRLELLGPDKDKSTERCAMIP